MDVQKGEIGRPVLTVPGTGWSDNRAGGHRIKWRMPQVLAVRGQPRAASRSCAGYGPCAARFLCAGMLRRIAVGSSPAPGARALAARTAAPNLSFMDGKMSSTFPMPAERAGMVPAEPCHPSECVESFSPVSDFGRITGFRPAFLAAWQFFLPMQEPSTIRCPLPCGRNGIILLRWGESLACPRITVVAHILPRVVRMMRILQNCLSQILPYSASSQSTYCLLLNPQESVGGPPLASSPAVQGRGHCSTA